MTKNKTKRPLVSVLTIAYNHGPYIEQMIKGVLMQETDFKFELIIHDDASTDDTAKIIKKYADKYPGIIRPIYETENQYSKGPYDFINEMFRSAEGKYIAFCEGDDYWTDPKKLQIQADFMERRPGYGLCFHPVQVVIEGVDEKPYLFPDPSKNGDYTLDELLRGNYIQINSVLYRTQNYDNLPNDVMPHDWYVHLYHAQFGKIGFIDRTMAVYRRHSGGVWWSAKNKDYKFWRVYALSYLKLYVLLKEMFGSSSLYSQIISRNIWEVFDQLFRHKENEDLLKLTIKKYPGLFVDEVRASSLIADDYNNQILLLQDEIRKLTKSNDLQHQKINGLEKIIEHKSMPVTKKIKNKLSKKR